MESDGELLRRYVSSGAEEPLSELLTRHGPMVLATCRRLVGCEADDAAQAVFILLARKARQLSSRQELGPWLYQACQYVARHMLRQRVRRQNREKEAGAMIAHESGIPEAARQELLTQVDSALGSLPERYREAIVLCYLERATQEQAARRLGVPEGTIAARCARGLERLREKLKRSGILLSLAALSSTLEHEAAAAATTFSVQQILSSVMAASKAGAVGASAGAANSSLIAEGVEKMLLLAKVKAAALVAVAVLGVGLVIPVALSAADGSKPVPVSGGTIAVPRAESRDGQSAPKRDEEKAESDLIVRLLLAAKPAAKASEPQKFVFDIAEVLKGEKLVGPLNVLYPGKKPDSLSYSLPGGETGEMALSDDAKKKLESMKIGEQFEVALKMNESFSFQIGYERQTFQSVTPAGKDHYVYYERDGKPASLEHIPSGRKVSLPAGGAVEYPVSAEVHNPLKHAGFSQLSQETQAQLTALELVRVQRLAQLEQAYAGYDKNRKDAAAFAAAVAAWKAYDQTLQRVNESLRQALALQLAGSAVLPLKTTISTRPDREPLVSLDGVNVPLKDLAIPQVQIAPAYRERTVTLDIGELPLSEVVKLIAEKTGGRAVKTKDGWRIEPIPSQEPNTTEGGF